MATTSVLKILDSVRNSHSLTRSLGDIQLWREENGAIFYRVGNSVVLFKIRYRGEWRAMRCYMRSVPHLAEIYGDKYLAEELYVYSGSKSGCWIDVVLERWVDGTTLREWVIRAVESGDRATLKSIADKFDYLASELLSKEWSHGDLTSENILVTPEKQLRLIDFDCKFIPQFAGQISPELGTAAYQPPSRQLYDFDRDIDDYSIALISTALRALSVDHTLYHKYHFYDGLIFNPALIANGACPALEEAINLFLDHNMAVAYRVAQLLKIGTLRIPPLRDIVRQTPLSPPDKKLQLEMKYGHVGYATTNGEMIIPPIYDDGLSFSEGVVMVQLAKKWMAINPQNEVIMSFEGYQKVKSLKGGVVKAMRDGVWVEV